MLLDDVKVRIVNCCRRLSSFRRHAISYPNQIVDSQLKGRMISSMWCYVLFDIVKVRIVKFEESLSLGGGRGHFQLVDMPSGTKTNS